MKAKEQECLTSGIWFCIQVFCSQSSSIMRYDTFKYRYKKPCRRRTSSPYILSSHACFDILHLSCRRNRITRSGWFVGTMKLTAERRLLHFGFGFALELLCLALGLASQLAGLALCLTGNLVGLALGLASSLGHGLLDGLSGLLCERKLACIHRHIDIDAPAIGCCRESSGSHLLYAQSC